MTYDQLKTMPQKDKDQIINDILEEDAKVNAYL